MWSPEEQGCQETPPAVVLGVVLERVFDDSNVDEAANLEVNVTKKFFQTTVPKSPTNMHPINYANLVSISSTMGSFCACRSLRRKKIGLDTGNLTVFFLLLGSLRVKAFRKHVGEIDPWSP